MNRAPLVHRVAAFALAAFLAAAALPFSSAADEPSNGARDPAGDVYPTAWAATAPGSVEHAQLVDLLRFEITHESKDDFVIEFQLADLPDEWKLVEAPPGGHPVPAVRVEASQPFLFDDAFMDNKVNHSAFFSLGGKRFVAVATLAEVDLRSPGAFPSVSSTDNLLQLLDALAAKIQETDLNAPPTGQAPIDQAAAAVADIRDQITMLCEEGQAGDEDVSPAQACTTTVPQGVRDEVDDRFDAVLAGLTQAQTLANGLPTASQAFQTGMDAALQLYADNKAVFNKLPSATVEGDGPAPQAPAFPEDPEDVAAPDTEGAGALLFHRFSLFEIDANGARIARASPNGLVDLDQDLVSMTVRKDAIGAKMGDRLTEFRAEGAFKGVRMDYAPDAAAGNPTPGGLSSAVLQQQVVTPAYGKDYQFAVAAAQPGEPAPPARIQLSAVGPASVEIAPGGSATYYVSLKNVAGSALGGYFSLSPDGEGWVSQVSDPVWSLGAGSSQVFTVVVAGAQGASAEKVTRLTAAIDGGESTFADLRTTMSPPPVDEAGDGPAVEEKAKKGRVPGLGPVVVLLALAALVVVARRRLE